MYPNPQEALPLPARPDLEQYRKLAKDLVRACRSGAADAFAAWAGRWLDRLARSRGKAATNRERAWIRGHTEQLAAFARSRLAPSGRRVASCALAGAQFVIARAHGFPSWNKLAIHVGGLVRGDSAAARFEKAADAIVAGDLRGLERLLVDDPGLVRARSAREHRATLLHYVSANGVEGWRQKTPRNVARIAQVLLEAGAEVDAEADVYGGGATALGLAATSVHPEKAGVQETLLEVLLARGAAIDHPRAGGRSGAVAACLANGRGRAAEFLASCGARLDLESAAGVGRLDIVRGFFDADGSLKPGSPKDQMTAGFLWACEYGRVAVVEFLLDRGADPGAQGVAGQTGLHMAAIGGQLETVRLLLAKKAPLEVKNVYGGTVFGQALWSAAHGGDSRVYAAILEALLAAGARLEDRHPPLHRAIDALLRRRGSRSDPTLAWHGEEPKGRRARRAAGRRPTRGRP